MYSMGWLINKTNNYYYYYYYFDYKDNFLKLSKLVLSWDGSEVENKFIMRL